MKPRVDELETLVRSRICAVCTERTVEGACSTASSRCSLFELFPLVAQAIAATDSDQVEPYIQAIRENVCSVCVEQRLDGSCDLRDQARCALDAYLIPIIDIIEEATGKSLAR